MSDIVKAAILVKTGAPLEIKKIELPNLQKGQVLIKVNYSGVCRSQLMEVRGGRGEDPWIPHMLGHEGSGEVLAIAEGVTKVKKGDKVILGWVKGEGLDAPGAKYICDGKVINSGKVTTFSTHTIVSESRVVKIPEGLPMDVAVLFGCALITGAGMVFNQLKPSEEDSVAVIGLGGIGLSALMALVESKCKLVIAIDIHNERLELAKAFGATHVINSQTENVHDIVMGLTNGGTDGCIESGGKTETIEIGFSLLKKSGGKLYFASHPPEGEYIKIAPHELICGKQIFGSWGGNSNPDIDIIKLASAYVQGKFPLEKLITKRYKLDQINKALEDIENGSVFRPLIEM